MKRTLLGMLATLAVALLPSARTASAQEINFASHSEIMTVLERQNQRIAELEATQHVGGGAGGCCSTTGCDSCCGSSCCDPCCRPGGVIGGVELSFLKFHESLGTRGADGTDLDGDYDPAYRLWAGYQGSDGLGWRVRYWEFDHATEGDSVAAPGVRTDSFDVDTYVFDLEFVDSMNLGCNWDASVFSGFRYVEFDHLRQSRVVATGTVFNAHEFDTAAYGLTLGGELRRCIGNGLAAFVNTRASVLFGDENEYTGAVLTLVDEELNNIYYIYEAQAGVQWTSELQSGGYLFARAAAEVQYWDNFVGEPFFDGGEAVGFGGVSLSAGIIR
jgi:hypothetical protein